MNDDVCMPVDGDDPGRLHPGPPGMLGCPKGPWRSRYEARDSFREYGKSGKFFHGSFDVKLVGFKKYSKSASTRLLCRRAGQPGRGAEPAVERRRTTKKCDCKWAVSLKARKLPEGEIFPEPTTTAPSKPPPPPPLSVQTQTMPRTLVTLSRKTTTPSAKPKTVKTKTTKTYKTTSATAPGWGCTS
jgi:hypothetical protein